MGDRKGMLRVLFSLALLLLGEYGRCEDPVDAVRRQGLWPQGKWQDLTRTHLHLGQDSPDHLMAHEGYRYPPLRLGAAATMWEAQRKMVMFGGVGAGTSEHGPDVNPLNDLWQFQL